MDHILEHEGQPVPDLGSITESSRAGARDTMDVDEDEDAEALKSLGATASGAVEAKVCSNEIGKYFDYKMTRTHITSQEHKMFRMW